MLPLQPLPGGPQELRALFYGPELHLAVREPRLAGEPQEILPVRLLKGQIRQRFPQL